MTTSGRASSRQFVLGYQFELKFGYVRCLNGSIELGGVPVRHRITGNAVFRGPVVVRHVIGAEDPIDPRHVHGEVRVDGLRRRAVMPVMKARHHQHAFQPAAPESHVRVNEHRVKRDEHEIGIDRRRREAQQDYGNEREDTGDDDVDQVKARSGDPVERDARVMDRVEPPERGHRVKEPMRRVFAEVGDDHDFDACSTSGCDWTFRWSHPPPASSTRARSPASP